MKIESDAVEIRSGVRHGKTMGGPIAVLVANRDYPNWDVRMNPWPVDEEVEETHLPRPGHADLAGLQKYGFTDVRNVLERASARETAARVAAGALAKGFLARARRQRPQPRDPDRLGRGGPAPDLGPEDFAGVDESPVRCLDADASKAMVAEIDRLRKENESLGGKFEVRAFGLVPGLGSHVSWDAKLDGRLAQAVCSIQSVKGVALGEAWDVASRPGSEAHDEIFHDDERGWYRERQPRGRPGGRDDERRAARGPGRDQADLDHDPAASLGRHRDEGAGPGDARAHRLHRGAGGRGRRRGDGRAGARRRLPREVRRRPHRRRPRGDRRLHGARRMAEVAPRPQPARSSIVLTGFMAAGKSAAAKVIAARLGLEARDSDAAVEAAAGRTVAEVFESEGEARFREREEQAVLALLGSGGGVVALGGGALGSERVREALADHLVVWCDVDEATAWERASRDGERPLAGDREAFSRLFAERRPLYESAARVVLPAAAREAAGAAAPWIAAMRAEPGLRMAWAESASGSYPAFVGGGATGILDAVRASNPGVVPERSFRVADREVAGLHPGLMPGAEAAILVDGGEATKTCPRPSACSASWRRPVRAETTWSSRSAAGSSAISRASARRPTSAGFPWSKSPRRWWRRSTRPTAARPASTCPRPRTTSVPTTSHSRSSRTRRC